MIVPTVALIVPEVPVTVIVYVPAVVPGVPGFPPPPPPPHPVAPAKATRTSRQSSAGQPRRRFGTTKNSRNANAVPPADDQKSLFNWFCALAAVVLTVNVEVCAVVPLTVTEAGFRLHVGMSLTPVIVVVTLQVKFTAPLNPFVPTTLMVPVFPVVPPGVTVKDVVPPLPAVKLGSGVILSATLVVALSEPEVPVIVTVTGLEVTVAEVLAASVRTWVPAPEPAAKLAVTPLGNPLAASVTPPEKLPTSVTVIVLVPLLPCAIDKLAGEGESVKPGGGLTVTVPVPVALL